MREVEKIVEVPVERIRLVKEHVEVVAEKLVTVDRIVEKPIFNEKIVEVQ